MMELNKVLEAQKRERGDISEKRWLDETTLNRAIKGACPRVKSILEDMKAKRIADAERIKRKPDVDHEQPEEIPAFAASPSPPLDSASMPPLSLPRHERESTAMTIDSYTHENCPMIPSDMFWEAYHFIGPDGQAHLTVGATEADLVPEFKTNPDLKDGNKTQVGRIGAGGG